MIDVNLKAVFFLSQAFARRMLRARAGGKIINIASLLSFQGGIRVPSYTASQDGVAGLTRLLANEWAAKGINVNAIAPGYIETNNTEALRADPDAQRGDPRPHSGRALGRAAGHRRRRRVPRLAGGQLRPWHRPAGRRRLARALRRNDGETGWHAWRPLRLRRTTMGAGDGVRRKVLCYDKGVMMVRVVDGRRGRPGAFRLHVQCSLVESGVLDITIAGRTERLRAGDSFLVESNALHGAVAVEAGTLLDVFVPMREDLWVGANGEWRRAPFASPRLRGEGSACGRNKWSEGSGGEGTVKKRRPAAAVRLLRRRPLTLACFAGLPPSAGPLPASGERGERRALQLSIRQSPYSPPFPSVASKTPPRAAKAPVREQRVIGDVADAGPAEAGV